ncbi:MAG: SDR family oxidoreductase [Casimicrobiaceae bacterium]
MILVTGASGRIGRRAAEVLHARGVALRLMSRNPASVPVLDGVDVIHGDFEQPDTLLRPECPTPVFASASTWICSCR